MTLQDLKTRFMNYLGSMDFDKMDISSLGSYAYLLKTLDDMEKPGYAESLALALGILKHKEEVEKNG